MILRVTDQDVAVTEWVGDDAAATAHAVCLEASGRCTRYQLLAWGSTPTRPAVWELREWDAHAEVWSQESRATAESMEHARLCVEAAVQELVS